MRVHIFRGDDAGYVSWLEAHPAGFVINIHKSYNFESARFHDVSRYTLRNQRGTLTDPYIKVCADQLAELEAWAITAVRVAIQPCGSCHARPRATTRAGHRYGLRGCGRSPCRPLPRAPTGAGQLGRRGVGRQLHPLRERAGVAEDSASRDHLALREPQPVGR